MRNDTIPAITILPLRVFLSISFLYAGIQKVLDPGFLQPGSATYLGKQILGFSHGSPIQFVLMHLMEHAVAVGWLTIAVELAVGVLVLLGLFTRVAALGGLMLSTGFFLSASWNTYPYFLGSDIVFMMCWLTLILTGPAAFALDTLVQPALRLPISERAREVLTGPVPTLPSLPARRGSIATTSRVAEDRVQVTRRESLLAGAATVVLVALGLLPRRGAGGTSSQLAGAPKNPAGGAGTSGATGGAGGAVPPGAKRVGNISQIPVNQAGTLTDPKTGDPAIIVRLGQHDLVAYDAVCTHAGCTVGYDPQQKLLSCPCHGATFDPAHDAQVTGGPAPSPLTKLEMSVDAQGNIYLV